MGAFAFVGAVLTIFIPETLGSVPVESMEDIETLGQGAKPFFAWWSTKKLKEVNAAHAAKAEEKKKEGQSNEGYEEL